MSLPVRGSRWPRGSPFAVGHHRHTIMTNQQHCDIINEIVSVTTRLEKVEEALLEIRDLLKQIAAQKAPDRQAGS